MDNDRIIGDCILRASSLRSLSEQIANEEFPSAEPVQLARALADTAEALAEHLISVRNGPAYSPEKDRALIRTIDAIIKWISEPLRYSEGAMTHRVPWSLIGPLQHLASRLLTGTTLIVRPKWRYNYTVLMSDLIDMIKSVVKQALDVAIIERCLGGLKTKLQIISFPLIERRSVLLHAVIAHEIGHIIAESFIAADKGTVPADLHAKVTKDVMADKTIGPLYQKVEIGRRLKEAAEYRKRALQEIGADLVAVNMLGPAAVFALDSVIGMKKLDDLPSAQSHRYPPRRYRLRLCLEELRSQFPGLLDWGILDAITPESTKYVLTAFRTHIDELSQIVAVKDDEATLKASVIIDVAYQWVRGSLDGLRQHVRGHCSGKSAVAVPLPALVKKAGDERLHSGTGFWLEVVRLVDMRLGRNIPPNTDDDTVVPPKPASFEAIMNAGWLFMLAKTAKRPANGSGIGEFVEQRHRVERLVLRALELAELQGKFIGYLNKAKKMP